MNPKVRHWIQAVALIALLVPLAFVAFLGTNSRYLADDFCTAGQLRELGFWNSQSYWYRNWSGRFSFTFLVSLSQLAGPELTPWLPGGVLLLWLAGSWWAAQQALAGERSPMLRPLVIAASTILVTVATTPKLYQSVLWHTGLLTYALPLALATLAAGWTLRALRTSKGGSPRWGSASIPGALAFVAGGMSETFVAVQTALLLIAIPLGLWAAGTSEKRRAAALHLGAALAGSLIAGGIVAAAPGNAVRQGALDRTADPLLVLSRSFRDTYLFTAMRYNRDLLWMAIGAAIPFGAGFGLGARRHSDAGEGRLDPRHALWLLILPVGTLLLVMATMAPSEYALSSYPDGRILITAHYAVAAGLSVWGAVLGFSLGQWLGRGGAAAAVHSGLWLAVSALLIVGSARFMLDHRPLLHDARQYAARWDNRHQQLATALERGEFRVEAASLTHMGGLEELSRDPQLWVNRCVADTYGLREVRAK